VSQNLTVNASGVAIADSTTYQLARGYGFSDSIGNNHATGYGVYATSTSTPATELGLLNRGTTATANPYRIRIEAASDTLSSSILVLANGSSVGGGGQYGISMATSMGSGILISANVDISGAGLQVGSATGGNLGSGKINVSGDIYKNNTAYTNPDFVFEHFYRGGIDKFAQSAGAADYAGLMPLADLRTYTQSNLRLPGMTDEPCGMFERGDQVLRYLEEHTLYLFDHEDRIEQLTRDNTALRGRIEALESRLQ